MTDSNSPKTELYALNQKGKPLSISIDRSNGRSASLIIPKTFIPINLCQQAKYGEIIDSPNYLIAIAPENAYIKIISSTEARAILDSPRGRKEVLRLKGDQLIETPANVNEDANEQEIKVSTNYNAITSSPDEDGAINQLMLVSQNGELTKELVAMLLDYCSENDKQELLEALGEVTN